MVRPVPPYTYQCGQACGEEEEEEGEEEGEEMLALCNRWATSHGGSGNAVLEQLGRGGEAGGLYPSSGFSCDSISVYLACATLSSPFLALSFLHFLFFPDFYGFACTVCASHYLWSSSFLSLSLSLWDSPPSKQTRLLLSEFNLCFGKTHNVDSRE